MTNDRMKADEAFLDLLRRTGRNRADGMKGEWYRAIASEARAREDAMTEDDDGEWNPFAGMELERAARTDGLKRAIRIVMHTAVGEYGGSIDNIMKALILSSSAWMCDDISKDRFPGFPENLSDEWFRTWRQACVNITETIMSYNYI